MEREEGFDSRSDWTHPGGVCTRLRFRVRAFQDTLDGLGPGEPEPTTPVMSVAVNADRSGGRVS